MLLVIPFIILSCGLLPNYPRAGIWRSEISNDVPTNNEVIVKSVSFTVNILGAIENFTIEFSWNSIVNNKLEKCTVKPLKLTSGLFYHEFSYKAFNQYKLLYDLPGTKLTELEKDNLRKIMATPIKMEPSSEFFTEFEINGKFISSTVIEGQYSLMMCEDKIVNVDSIYGDWKAGWVSE
jgi:hypothetical protein